MHGITPPSNIHQATGSKDSVESALWAQFTESGSIEDFSQSWLAIQCRMLTNIVGGLVLLGKSDVGPYIPTAVWPDPQKDMAHLTDAAEKALTERRGIVEESNRTKGTESSEKIYQIGYPLIIEGSLHGVVILEVTSNSNKQLQSVLRQLHWGMAWLETLLRKQEMILEKLKSDRMSVILDHIGASLDYKEFKNSATALVTELATYLGCDRASLGFKHRNKTHIEALSHSAQFNKNSNLMSSIRSVMDEAIGQRKTIIYPPLEKKSSDINHASKILCEKYNHNMVLTIPIAVQEKYVGAIVLERSREIIYKNSEIELCESIASLNGIILWNKLQSERSFLLRSLDVISGGLKKIFGARHYLIKTIIIMIFLLITTLSFISGEYKVSADTNIEGSIQRVVVAPFNSFITSSHVRAGDIVKKDMILARLDSKDLELEKIKWVSEKAQIDRQYREAMASHDYSTIQILSAKHHQSDAQLDLIKHQLQRTTITAPFDGVVISGDLDQSLGAPVERGQMLFEISPLNEYRVILEVKEQDISVIEKNQKGELRLTALPDDSFDIFVEKITPVSVAGEGRNYFRVEAKLLNNSNRLRPGMEGVGKIYVDERKLIWIWTHDLVDWVDLWFWSWWPS